MSLNQEEELLAPSSHTRSLCLPLPMAAGASATTAGRTAWLLTAVQIQPSLLGFQRPFPSKREDGNRN